MQLFGEKFFCFAPAPSDTDAGPRPKAKGKDGKEEGEGEGDAEGGQVDALSSIMRTMKCTFHTPERIEKLFA